MLSLQLMIALALCATLALVAGQNYLFGPRHFDYNSIDVPQATGASGRDPRQNRGKFQHTYIH